MELHIANSIQEIPLILTQSSELNHCLYSPILHVNYNTNQTA